MPHGHRTLAGSLEFATEAKGSQSQSLLVPTSGKGESALNALLIHTPLIVPPASLFQTPGPERSGAAHPQGLQETSPSWAGLV